MIKYKCNKNAHVKYSGYFWAFSCKPNSLKSLITPFNFRRVHNYLRQLGNVRFSLLLELYLGLNALYC